MKVKRAFQRAYAYADLSNDYIIENNHEMAKRTRLDERICRDKAWELVFEIHPSLRNKRNTYLYNENRVIILNK